MNSHPDADSVTQKDLPQTSLKDQMDILVNRVKEMSDRGENHITAGAPSEKPLSESILGGMIVRQLPDDPFALRISIGDPSETLAGQGVLAYCVFRGDRKRVIELLSRALTAMRGE